jgi:hypothetical protein
MRVVHSKERGAMEPQSKKHVSEEERKRRKRTESGSRHFQIKALLDALDFVRKDSGSEQARRCQEQSVLGG